MEIKDTAVRAVKKAGLLLKENISRAHRVDYKSAVDIVTEMDMKAEALIMDEIRRDFPDHGILTEESPEIKSASGRRWIIDPLDGTTNYAHGFPVFCVSVAFEDKGRVLFGAVYNPMLNELFTGEKGKGAFLNGVKIKASSVATLDKSLLATGFPYDIRTSELKNLDNFASFSVKAQAIRRAGSAALDLSYVACGRFDGFWEMKLKPWDTAAAALFVREAGGVLTDFKGEGFDMNMSECLASNGLIHKEMLDVLMKG
ncbi:MAG: inositol monophosphatase, partial [Deltaproteobacteria bacterium]|nr:inositol monophosphatase [Deltaproteobacteria bacterium]